MREEGIAYYIMFLHCGALDEWGWGGRGSVQGVFSGTFGWMIGLALSCHELSAVPYGHCTVPYIYQKCPRKGGRGGKLFRLVKVVKPVWHGM